ncbi:MAG TPA: DUF6065 family protein [Terriglobales bacterium]|nr:DUF6065 family protein [Terriglobales bacterium]
MAVQENPRLICYRVPRTGLTTAPPEPASRRRLWMDRNGGSFANFCLPMLIANQAGWELCSTHAIEVVWNGGSDTQALQVIKVSGEGKCPATSHFGFGILTWRLPFLFRTSPGWQLLARGPANSPKDGIAALEGIVETDSSVATFTMNWVLTRPDRVVRFEVGEPFAVLVPQRIQDLENIAPVILPLDADPDLAARYRAWAGARRQYRDRGISSRSRYDRFQLDYLRGTHAAHDQPEFHRSKIVLRRFLEPGK